MDGLRVRSTVGEDGGWRWEVGGGVGTRGLGFWEWGYLIFDMGGFVEVWFLVGEVVEEFTG